MTKKPFIKHCVVPMDNRYSTTFYGEEDTAGFLNISVARCANNDQYSKKEGRAIAKLRLDTHGPLLRVKAGPHHEMQDVVNFLGIAIAMNPLLLPHVDVPAKPIKPPRPKYVRPVEQAHNKD